MNEEFIYKINRIMTWAVMHCPCPSDDWNQLQDLINDVDEYIEDHKIEIGVDDE